MQEQPLTLLPPSALRSTNSVHTALASPCEFDVDEIVRELGVEGEGGGCGMMLIVGDGESTGTGGGDDKGERKG